MRTDVQKEANITKGIAQMDINSINDGNQNDKSEKADFSNQCCDSENKCCDSSRQESTPAPATCASSPPKCEMFGRHGNRRHRHRDVPGMMPPEYGYLPFSNDMFDESCSPIEPLAMGFSTPFGHASSFASSSCGTDGFNISENHTRKNGCMKWKRWTRKMGNGEDVGCETFHDSNKCKCKPSETNRKEKHQSECDNPCADETSQADDCIDEFEQSLGAPPVTHLMMMQMHHLRMARHHRIIAQQFAKRNHCVVKQRCRAMRKCGISREHIKAWRQQVKQWKKTHKHSCEANNSDDKEETSSEEEAYREEQMV